ncbi:MAG: DUF2130 domain-containing protein [Defluviitaleaceae bacterium]|nr:DUF2130 domain-containing protein [Defluviitaleaceae bacterium]MCL2837111.1 DUF2130 domain-containing protein [Defluviitaleaceae bacterium]
MNPANIVCPNCKKAFEISDAFSHQIQDELQKAKTEQSESLRKEYNIFAETKIRQAVQNAVTEAQKAADLRLTRELQSAKLELDKAKQATELELERTRQSTELELERLRRQAENQKESERQLRGQLSALLEELSKAGKAKDDAELAARKELLGKEKLIREEAIRTASEDFNTKIREQEEVIGRLREQLTTAKQVAEQGSQQLQGEILELDIEQSLRGAFIFDTVDEVKKGERGSDIRQIVNEAQYQNCGLILWECKNAKTYQASWLGKLKDELVMEKAQIGVIVFNSADGGDFKQLADNIWLVKPRYAVMLATFLREVLIKVAVANRNNEGKDVKVEMIYNYLTGGEFNNRIRYIIESYDEMARQLDIEKKQAQKRWAAQEKILEKVTSSFYGMSGDLQGIAGKDIITLPSLGDDDEIRLF